MSRPSDEVVRAWINKTTNDYVSSRIIKQKLKLLLKVVQNKSTNLLIIAPFIKYVYSFCLVTPDDVLSVKRLSGVFLGHTQIFPLFSSIDSGVT